MPTDNKIQETEPNFKGGLPEGAEIVLLVDGAEVVKTDVAWFDVFLDDSDCAPDRFNFKVLSSQGWTDINEVARRGFWEHESIVALSVRKGKARFACGTMLPIVRSGKPQTVAVENLAAGDTLTMHDYMMLRKGHTEPKKQVIVRGQGLMEKQKVPADGAKVYCVRTASGDIVADGIVVLTSRQ